MQESIPALSGSILAATNLPESCYCRDVITKKRKSADDFRSRMGRSDCYMLTHFKGSLNFRRPLISGSTDHSMQYIFCAFLVTFQKSYNKIEYMSLKTLRLPSHCNQDKMGKKILVIHEKGSISLIYKKPVEKCVKDIEEVVHIRENPNMKIFSMWSKKLINEMTLLHIINKNLKR